MNLRSQKTLGVLLLIIVGFSLYAFNLDNSLFWDDDDWIVNNPAVHALRWQNVKSWFTQNVLAGVGLQSNYYRPFLFFTFAFNYATGGVNSVGYHVVSNAIHLLNGVILFLLLQKVVWPNGRKGILWPFLVSLAFIAHPLQTEAVTYISGRGDPLSVFFMLIALYFFVRAEQENTRVKFKKAFSYALLILALLSKETAIVFPGLAGIWYMAFISKDRFWMGVKKGLVKIWPYIGIVLAYGILRLTILNFDNTLDFYAVPNIYSENLHVRLFTFMHVLLIYLKLLFIPTGLHMERSVDIHLSPFSVPVIGGIAVIVAVIWQLVKLYKKERAIGDEKRISDFRIWLFGAGWFFTGLLPVSGITPINAQLYEHWLYLPLIGFFSVLFFYVERLLDFFKTNRKKMAYLLFLLFLTVYGVFYSVQSIRRNIIWGKPIEFYENILRYSPNSVRINNNLGNRYYEKGEMDKAEYRYRQAIMSEDIFPQPHYNLGTILQARGDIDGAISEYAKAIELNPRFYYPYQNLAGIYIQQNDIETALDYASSWTSLRPDDPVAHYTMALIYLRKGEISKSREHALKAISLNPPDKVRDALREVLIRVGN